MIGKKPKGVGEQPDPPDRERVKLHAQASGYSQIIQVAGDYFGPAMPGPASQEVLVLLRNFETYLERVGSWENQLALIPEGMWPVIDATASMLTDDFLATSGLDPAALAGTVPGGMRGGLEFLLKAAWERGYFLARFHRHDYLPPPDPVNPLAIMDAIVALGGPSRPDQNLGLQIRVTIQQSVSIMTGPEPVRASLHLIDSSLANEVEDHLSRWGETVRRAFGWGILAEKSEAGGGS